MGVSRQFVQTVCNDMLSRGFIEFTDNPRHKRSKLAALTESGRIAFRQARQKENEIIEQALPGIDSGTARSFLMNVGAFLPLSRRLMGSLCSVGQQLSSSSPFNIITSKTMVYDDCVTYLLSRMK